ncbi:MAG: DUF3791 domain-containing protein [Saccharofermentans sp.]|nr:DUF3791 domain-containing protein [Saccharofermentans sp.]
MSEKMQIIFMQIRLVQLASDKWNMTIEGVLNIFEQYQVLDYIKTGFGIFHCEGDETILDDIEEFLKKKGMVVNVRTA